ncbi:Disease resistance protein (NBS class) family [Raphanus sativus]|nr:Disease resistance protein (NBS class) family [Raphanus sativus]
MVAISGPAGIGKTTIARALHSRFSESNRFQLTCFVDNLRGSCRNGLDEYGLKLRSQEKFLSKILNQNGMTICHLGAVKEWLHDKRALIILDDVDDLKQLEALAHETTWFGRGSRIVVTTENKELLQQHGINNTYHVRFPTRREALEILCRYAFRQNYPHYGFREPALKVTELCGDLPLGLRVVGSTLRGKNEEEWEQVIRRLETILDHQDIEQVLRVGYESLHEKEQSLFLHIAVFFNYKDGDLVKAMFADNNLDVKYGLNILTNRSLIYSSEDGEIEMHKLLQLMATKAVSREEPWRRRILIDAEEICDVLERADGTRAVSGISFDISDMKEVSISHKAFTRMPNLRFLKIYKSRYDGNDTLHRPEEMEFPRRLRLLHWEACPLARPLANLKEMCLSWSVNLKELPDLSKAANLEKLVLRGCSSLLEIPSSIGNLDKLDWLDMGFCRNLQDVPDLFKLAPHSFVDMRRCSRMRKFPDISTNTTTLVIADTMLSKLPKSSSVCLWPGLLVLSIFSDGDDDGIGIQELPDWIKNLHRLRSLSIYGCSKLASLPELPRSLERLTANGCESPKKEHLCIFYCGLVDGPHEWLEEENEVMFEFFTCKEIDIIECGVQILKLKDEPDGSNNGGSGYKDGDSDHWNTQASGQDSDEEEEADFSVTRENVRGTPR